MTSARLEHFTTRAMERAGLDRQTAIGLFYDLAYAVRMYDAMDPVGHAHVDFIRKGEYNRRMFRCNIKGAGIMVAVVGLDGTPITIMTPEFAKRYKSGNKNGQKLARLEKTPQAIAIAGSARQWP